MREELKIIQNEDGTFSEYDDTFDITIHCKSEEEQNEVLAKLNTPQQKMGRWVEEDMFDGDVAYRCTKCNEVFSLIYGTPKDNEYNYCPNCGCRMDGGE